MDAVSLLKAHGIATQLQDERIAGISCRMPFRGELRLEQTAAAEAILAHDDGILAATTAFGKTVVAAHCIAMRSVNTLVLVHRRQLQDQWRERLSTFLEIDPESIGTIGGGKNARTGIIDIALI